MAVPKKKEPKEKPGKKALGIDLSPADIKELSEFIRNVESEGNAEEVAEFNKPVLISEMVPEKRQNTGIVSLNFALGGGFLPHRQYEISGPENIGKSLEAKRIMKHIVREVERPGLYVDLEGSEEATWAKFQFGDVADKVLYHAPVTCEIARLETLQAIRANYSVVVVDSIGGVESEGNYASMENTGSSGQKGMTASFMSSWCRSVRAAQARYNSDTNVIWINQLRTAGLMSGQAYDSPMGGKAMGYYPAVRIGLGYVGGDTVPGRRLVRWKINKSKISLGRPMFILSYNPDGSIDFVDDLVTACVEYGVIEKRGGWYYLGGKQIGQGIEAVVEKFRLGGEKVQMDLYNYGLKKISEAPYLVGRVEPDVE